jgi:hypothetical protein
MNDKHSIALADLFPQADGRDQLHFAGLQQSVASKIASHLHLAFLPDPTAGSGSVCLANAEGVQQAYRTAVTAREIFYYLVAMLEDHPWDRGSIPYPTSLEDFWKRVEQGYYLGTNSGPSSRISSSERSD